jgi:hypothetical protein
MTIGCLSIVFSHDDPLLFVTSPNVRVFVLASKVENSTLGEVSDWTVLVASHSQLLLHPLVELGHLFSPSCCWQTLTFRTSNNALAGAMTAEPWAES